jgi:nucleotide-binding universal stress UspA family protein
MSSDDTQSLMENPAKTRRKFLCVVDASSECSAAVHFAARRASQSGGRVALLFVIEPEEFQHWAAVKDIMLEEARTEAEEVLQRQAVKVKEVAGEAAELVIREGKIQEQIHQLIVEDKSVGVLVLGAATGKDGPGPLVSTLAGRDHSSRFPIPVTVVPGDLTTDEIDALT